MNYILIGTIIFCCIWEYIFIDYLDKMYTRKYDNKYIYFISWIILTSIFVLVNLIKIPVLNSLYSFLSVTVLTVLLYKNYGNSFLLYNVYFVLLMVFLDILSVLFVTCISVINYYDFIKNDILMMYIGLPICILGLFFNGIVVGLFKKQKIKKISLIENIFVCVEIFFEIILIAYISLLIKDEEYSSSILLAIVFVFLLINLCQLYLFRYAYSYHSLKQKVLLYEQQRTMMSEYYGDVDEKYRESMKLFHDINKHLNVLENLYVNEGKEKALGYMTKVTEKLQHMVFYYKYENKIINLLLNDKYKVCKAKGIKLIVKIQDISLEPVNDFDLTTIFGNLLDNAVDACKEVEDQNERRIEIRLHRFNNYLVSQIINSTKEMPKRSGGIFVSKKEGHVGIGLSNVTETIHKYGGNIEFECNDNVFVVKFVIPLGS